MTEVPIAQRPDRPFLPGECFDTMNLASLTDPRIRSSIPDLGVSLETWLRTGDMSLLQARVMMMPRAHLAPVFVMNAYGFVNEVGVPNSQQRPFMIVNHEPGFSAEDNERVLAKQKEVICQTLGINQLPKVLKTITLEHRGSKGGNIVLVSGVGDFQLDNNTKRTIGRELGLSRSVSRNTVVNPGDFDTTLFLGLQPGMIKPILEPYLIGNVRGICYLKGSVKPEDFVAISVSHVDSMIMQVRDFEFLFKDYAADNYRGFQLSRKPEYDFYSNNRRFE